MLNTIDSIITRLERHIVTPKHRFTFTLMVIIMLVSGYILLNNNLTPKVDLLIPLDEQIPYWPWTASIYFSLYPLYLIAAISFTPRQYIKVVLGIIFMTLVSFVSFALITSHYPRPDPSAWAHSAWAPIIDLMVLIDSPGNTCPSLHVSTALYVGWMMRKQPRGRFWITWGFIISLSTLTLKQHFVWDWVGGAILATLTALIQQRTITSDDSPISAQEDL